MNGFARISPTTIGYVAIILAAGIMLAVNAITVAILIDALRDPKTAGISENATQILTTAFSGAFGILGAYVGYRAAGSSNSNNGGASSAPPPEEEIPPEEQPTKEWPAA